MNVRRTYSEEEVSIIFERATEAQESARKKMPHREGLSLSELEEIGADLGITPEYIHRAVSTLDTHVPSRIEESDRLSFGRPYAYERIIELPRGLTDLEWDRLVVDLRETFSARGEIKSDGSLREWTHSQLHALIEPARDGYRMRIFESNTYNRDLLTFGAFLGILSVAMSAIITFSESFGDNYFLAGITLLVAITMFAMGWIKLPKWHKERTKKISEIGSRLTAAMAATGKVPGLSESNVDELTRTPSTSSSDKSVGILEVNEPRDEANSDDAIPNNRVR